MPQQKLDPRDLISPPWTLCPKCGKQEFGISIISGSSLMRRCRDCWHKQDYRLPALRKKIVYLDQFVISNLMKLQNPSTKGHARVLADPFWRQLCDLLFELRHFQMICCPDSRSHEQESRTSPFNAELRKVYQDLSGGIRFKSFDSIDYEQIGELAFAWAEKREPRFDFDPKHALSADPNGWSERFYIVFGDNPFTTATSLRQMRTQVHANITRLFKDVWAKEKQSFEYWYNLERKGYQGNLGAAVVRDRQQRARIMLKQRLDAEISLEDLDQTLPSFAESLLASLQHIMRFPRDGGERSPEQVRQLEKEFGQANRIAEAPFVRLQALMFAAIAVRAAQGQKNPPNEGTTTDIDIVAHLLPYCDAMFMDNGCRSLMLDIPKAFRPPEAGKIYSPNIREDFLNYLRSIRDTMSAEHLQTVRELYGEPKASNHV